MQKPLTHLFKAVFTDTKVIEQNPDDKSSLAEDKNCFFDVLEYLKVCKLEAFFLVGLGNTYAIDFKDGHFEVNGIPFLLHDPCKDMVKEFNLVRFMRNYKNVNIIFKDGKQIGAETIEHLRDFAIGWQGVNQKGQSVERTMLIPGDAICQ